MVISFAKESILGKIKDIPIGRPGRMCKTCNRLHAQGKLKKVEV